MPNAAWTWLSKENNRSTLILLGGAVAALAGAFWAVYTYQPPAKPPTVQAEATTGSVPQPSQTAIADNGGIAINADGGANVSVHQTKP
jgi:hypothetical protein